MERKLPYNLINFFKNAYSDMDDGYEYSSELNRILNSDDCQRALTPKEIDKLREFSDIVRKNIGEFNNYTKEQIKEFEKEIFGAGGINRYLGIAENAPQKPMWPLFK